MPPTRREARRFPLPEIRTGPRKAKILRFCNLFALFGISMGVETMLSPSVVPAKPAMVMTKVVQNQPQQAGLVERASQGDVQAFEELYRANSGRVYALCLRMSGDPTVAEDLVQESFIRAWEKLGTFRHSSAFSTWLHRVTVNVVLGDRRRTSRREGRVNMVGDEAMRDSAARTPSPADTLDLEKAIASLPDGARTVFVLHDVEGFLHTEIANLAGIAVGTSKAQLHRARKLLRKALQS